MTTINQKIELWSGDTRVIAISVVNIDGTPYDLSDANVMWWAAPRADSADADVFIKKAIGTGVTVVPGGVQIVVASDDTENVAPGNYYHEMKIAKGSDVTTAMTGQFIVHRSLVVVP